MDKIKNSEKNVKFVILAILDYLLALLIILNSNSEYKFISSFTSFNKISFALLIIILLLVFVIKRPFSDNKSFIRGLIITAILSAYLLIFGFLNASGLVSSLNLILPFAVLSAYFFICTDKDKIPHVIFAYEHIIIVIAAVSVICWLLFSILRLIPNTGVIESLWGASDQPISLASFFGIYFETQYQEIFGHIIMRNTAIFTEAPMFAWNLLIAFLIELFVKKNIRVVNIVILSIALITTISTMGYIVALVAAIVKIVICILHSRFFTRLSKKVKIIALVIAIVIVGICILFCILLLIRKMSSDSGSDRLYDYLVGFKAWMDYPVLGAGYENRSAIAAHRAIYSDSGFSNGIMDVAAQGGIYLLIWFVGPYVYGFINAVRSKNVNIACFALSAFLLAAINCSEYTYLAFMLQLFMLHGLVRSDKLSQNTIK